MIILDLIHTITAGRYLWPPASTKPPLADCRFSVKLNYNNFTIYNAGSIKIIPISISGTEPISGRESAFLLVIVSTLVTGHYRVFCIFVVYGAIFNNYSPKAKLLCVIVG